MYYRPKCIMLLISIVSKPFNIICCRGEKKPCWKFTSDVFLAWLLPCPVFYNNKQQIAVTFNYNPFHLNKSQLPLRSTHATINNHLSYLSFWICFRELQTQQSVSKLISTSVTSSRLMKYRNNSSTSSMAENSRWQEATISHSYDLKTLLYFAFLDLIFFIFISFI